MTCGIYRLVFENCDKYYIGQSVNIDKRFINHLYRLRHGKHNYKMQKTYALHGEPYLDILTECTPEQLNENEKECIEIFNSVDNGLNIADEPSIFQEGDKNGASKYPNDLIESVFKLLLNLDNRYQYVADITGVNVSTVRHIANGESHTWLQRQFPEEYNLLISYRGRGGTRASASNSAKSQGKKYPPVKRPITGEVFEIENANAFARENGLDPSYFIKLLNGKALSCKGWKLAR